jgi:3-isopropylmalate/(R)-2-methylmalate dehydratase large subunit
MSVFQTIIESRLDAPVAEGDIVTVPVDRLYVQDGNAPTMARYLDELGACPADIRIAPLVVFDHSSTAPTAGISTQLALARQCARRFGFDIVREGSGISHAYAAEKKMFRPGSIVLGSDSHTCAGGAFQCLALGMGMSDILFAMLTGTTWLKIPQTRQIRVRGTLSPGVTAKDLVLFILAALPEESLSYTSIEFVGDTIHGLSDDAAQTLSSMAVDLGAKCCFLDRPATRDFPGLRKFHEDPSLFLLDIDAASVPCMVAAHGSAQKAVPLDELAGERVDMCFLGSCTNGRYDDFVAFTRALAGRTVARDVLCQAAPASSEVHLRLMQSGILEVLLRAGVLVTPAGCGPCAGVQGHIPHDGATVLSTMNRNFKGRMGNRNANIVLCSPVVLAHAAATGVIPTMREVADAL